MSDAEDARGLLDQLRAQRDTGCLTIASADGLVCRVYILAGQVFHAVGPTAEGESALAEALLWPDVTLSFDDNAELPTKQTINATPSTPPVRISFRRLIERAPRSARPVVQVQLVRAPKPETAAPNGSEVVSRLSDDPRLTKMSIANLGGGCLLILVPLLLFGIAALLSSRGINSDGFATAAVISLPVILVLWLIVIFGYRVTFFRDAVEVAGALPRAAIPRVVDAPVGVISGEPELVIKMRARSTIGKLGKCRIELYTNGLQIWRGAKHSEPRWQFSYRDLLQAESVDLMSVGGRSTTHQYFVRVIAAEPRIAFLFGNAWLVNRKAKLLVNKLREHQVPTFTEILVS